MQNPKYNRKTFCFSLKLRFRIHTTKSWFFFVSNKLQQSIKNTDIVLSLSTDKSPIYFTQKTLQILAKDKGFCILNPIEDGSFRCCSRIGGGAFLPPFNKIRHTYSAMMKLGKVIPYLRKIQKMYHLRDTSHEFCWHEHFFTENQQILQHQEIRKQFWFWYIISNSFDFSWVFSNSFNKHCYNFDDVSKSNYFRPS